MTLNGNYDDDAIRFHCRAGNNSIYCSTCKTWIHRRCSGVKGTPIDIQSYMCAACRHRPQVDPVSDVQELNEIKLDGKVSFEMVVSFVIWEI